MRKLIVAATFAAIAVPAAAQAQDYGTKTCLKPYVWREAFSGDRVCVSDKTRTQVARDNAAAASRRDPNAGYGPKGCKPTFVWRAAVPSDLVCVDPDQRTQAARDNAAASQRVNSVRVTLDNEYSQGRWVYEVNVTNVNAGEVYIGFYKSNGTLIKGRYAPARTAAVGGRVAWLTSHLFCNGRHNAYFRVKDMTSGRWSERVPATAGCVPI